MKRKESFTFIELIILIVVLVVLMAVINLLRLVRVTNDPIYKETGWTTEEFIEWAKEVQPVREHKRWKISKDGEPNLMDPNENFLCAILNDANDVPFIYPVYLYEWDFQLPSPYKKLPLPVKKVLDCLKKESVGKNIGEMFPFAARPITICALQDDKIVSSEAFEVQLVSLAEDKLNFAVQKEPFIFSENPDVRGKIGNRIILYAPKGNKPSKIVIGKPERR